MKIIAIETSGRQGSVAALVGESGEARLIRQTQLADNQRSARALAPALKNLLEDIGWTPPSIGLVAVAVGPGSFTGLRIGVTTAKTLAYATGASVMGVNTLAALAAQAPSGPGRLWAILDAQRQELFVAEFGVEHPAIEVTDCHTSILSQEAWLAGLRAGDRVIGPALRRLAPRLPTGIKAAAEDLWEPMAAAVGQVAWRSFEAGRRYDLWKLAPQYYRPSYAEEKLP
jgi:tRNA threonylcarbamoyladenosine biosynthesis protein TsaB